MKLLDRISEENALESRRAAIEALLSAVDKEHFQNEHGEVWPEWIATFQASREFTVDKRRKGDSGSREEFL